MLTACLQQPSPSSTGAISATVTDTPGEAGSSALVTGIDLNHSEAAVGGDDVGQAGLAGAWQHKQQQQQQQQHHHHHDRQQRQQQDKKWPFSNGSIAEEVEQVTQHVIHSYKYSGSSRDRSQRKQACPLHTDDKVTVCQNTTPQEAGNGIPIKLDT